MAKKTKVKKKSVLLVVIIFAIIITACVLSYNIFGNNTNKGNNGNGTNNTKPPVKEEIKEKRMSLVAVGDALIHGAVYLDASIGNNNYDFSPMFTLVKPLIEKYDLKYYNQETIIGGKNLGVQHYPRFNSPDDIALNLIDLGFNLVSLANNHALDMGEAGILNSVSFWRDKDVVVSGQNDSYEDRESKIKVYEKNGIKYAFIAYTDSTNGLAIPSGKDYLINVYSPEQAKEDIDKIKDQVDVIIVSMHWGNEYVPVNYVQEEEAEYLSSLGVNLIIGSHPHVVQPVKYVGDTLVIYSLGNFISGQSPLGIDKIIGLMVGMDIVVKDKKVTFENLDYKLLYTYCTSNYKNYKVIPFSDLDDSILPNYKSYEEKYMEYITNDGAVPYAGY